jgi:predicted negative regulator of RcsB-dependent stress response
VDNTVIFTIINLVILGLSAWSSFRRNKAQNVVDDSQAAINYRNIVVALQAEVKEARAETKEVKDMLDNAHLEIKLEIQIGDAPVIKSWEWKKRIDVPVAPI